MVKPLLQLPAVKSITDIKGIKMIYDKVEANVRELEALAIASDNYGSLLVPVMTEQVASRRGNMTYNKSALERGIWQRKVLF